MSTSIAISSAALASSAAANQAALQARKTSCLSFEAAYRPELADVGQKQQYAECVGLLYPKPAAGFSENEIWFFKGLIIVLLLSMIIGFVRGDGYGAHQSIGDRLCGAFLAFCGVTAAIVVLGLLTAAGIFLFS
ncbi:hypothetical protein D3C77_105890 [compost metagenome]